MIVPVPIGLATVCLSRQCKINKWIKGLAFQHATRPLVKPISHAERRSYLSSSRLVWRLQQGVTQAVGHGQILPDAPGVLAIPLPLVRTEMAGNRLPFRQGSERFSQVIVGTDLGNHTGHRGDWKIVAGGKAGIYSREIKGRRVEARTAVGNAGTRQPKRIRGGSEERGGI